MISAEINFKDESEVFSLCFDYLPRIGEKVWAVNHQDPSKNLYFIVEEIEYMIDVKSNERLGVDQKVSIFAKKITRA